LKQATVSARDAPLGNDSFEMLSRIWSVDAFPAGKDDDIRRFARTLAAPRHARRALDPPRALPLDIAITGATVVFDSIPISFSPTTHNASNVYGHRPSLLDRRPMLVTPRSRKRFALACR
jgi:hypothetical protein